MRPKSFSIAPVMTSFATPYSAGDSIGIPIEVANFFDAQGHRAKLISGLVKDWGNQAPAFTILLFSGTLTGTYTDNDAVDISTADWAKLCGVIRIATAGYSTYDAHKIQHISAIEAINGGRDGGSLWAVCYADDAYTAGAADQLVITADFETY